MGEILSINLVQQFSDRYSVIVFFALHGLNSLNKQELKTQDQGIKVQIMLYRVKCSFPSFTVLTGEELI